MSLNNLKNQNIQENCGDRHKKERISAHNFTDVRIVIIVEIELSGLIGTGEPSRYAENLGNLIFL